MLHGEQLYEVMKDVFSGSKKPTGIFVYSDCDVVERVIPALGRLNLKVPEDVSIVGFYNTPHAENYPCPLTSISICEEEIAKCAFDLLLNGKPGEKILIQPRLVERKSVRRRGNRQ